MLFYSSRRATLHRCFERFPIGQGRQLIVGIDERHGVLLLLLLGALLQAGQGCARAGDLIEEIFLVGDR